MTDVRKGQAPAKLGRDEFRLVFHRSFMDPSFKAVATALDQVEQTAWENYVDSHKAPVTVRAGEQFTDPDYALSVEWKEARDRLLAAEAFQKLPSTRSRVLLINASARNDGTCPGEISKTYRMTLLAKEVLEADGVEVDMLDLSLLTSDYDRHIHPCKGCASTAMPLCHWPCSCYPNHSLRQTNDWMNEIYEKWVAAHGVIIMTPVYWYQTPAVLKLMIDRLVCADGGNPDPTVTQGKKAALAKEVELAGWDYPKHLAGRVFGVVAHGDASGTESLATALTNWLEDIGLVRAGKHAVLERFIGYLEPYATSHGALDRDEALRAEVSNLAKTVIEAIVAMRSGRLVQPGIVLEEPRPK